MGTSFFLADPYNFSGAGSVSQQAEKSFKNLQHEKAHLRKLVTTAPLRESFMIGFILGALLMLVTLCWVDSMTSEPTDNEYHGAVM